MAFAASHYILLPATPETQAVLGANRALLTATTMRALTNEGSLVVGGLITRWKKSVPAEQSLAGLVDIMNKNGVRLFATRIPEDAKVECAHQQTYSGGLKNLFHITTQQGPAADAYESLMKELLLHVHRN
jgi:cellulose biosynthesis protein BcsQ